MRALKTILVSLCALSVSAQILDTTDAHLYKPIEVYALSSNGLIWMEEDSSKLDTQMHGFNRSYSLYSDGFPFLDLGYEGSPSLLLNRERRQTLDVKLGINAMEYYLFNDDLVRYHTSRPFTRLNYSQGNNELVFIEATHAQQVSERLTFGIDYRRLKNQNFYYGNIFNADQQRFANIFNTKFYTGYYSKDRKYELLVGFVYNKSNNIETGGLADQESFESVSGRNKLNNNEVFLSNANNNYASHSYTAHQYLRLAGSKVDTTSPGDLSRFRLQLVHHFKYRAEKNEYIDETPDSAYYGVKLDEVHDSVNHRHLSNSLGLTLDIGKLKLYSAVIHQYDRVYQDSAWVKDFNAILIDGRLRIKLNEHIHSKANIQLALNGYNAGGYSFQWDAAALYGKHELNAVLSSDATQTTFMNQFFEGDVLQWTFNRSKVIDQAVEIGHQYKTNKVKTIAEIKAQRMDNPIFMDSTIIPKQFNGAVNLLTQKAGIEYTFGPFVLSTSILHLNSSNQSILPRPEWTFTGDLYVNIRLFKKRLHTQLGVNSQWFSDFSAPRYNPYTRMWLNTEENFSYYSPINLYLHAKVKSFYMGINVFHIQQGFMGEGYYSSPAYPVMPRALRLNLRWDLSN